MNKVFFFLISDHTFSPPDNPRREIQIIRIFEFPLKIRADSSQNNVTTNNLISESSLTVFSMETSVEACVIYKLTVNAWRSVKKPLLIAALSLVHFLLSNCICPIQNWILDSLDLYNSATACFLESSLDVLVLLHIF